MYIYEHIHTEYTLHCTACVHFSSRGAETKRDLEPPTRRDYKGNSMKIHREITSCVTSCSSRPAYVRLTGCILAKAFLNISSSRTRGQWGVGLVFLLCETDRKFVISREFEMGVELVKKEFESFLSVHAPEACVG